MLLKSTLEIEFSALDISIALTPMSGPARAALANRPVTGSGIRGINQLLISSQVREHRSDQESGKGVQGDERVIRKTTAVGIILTRLAP